MPDDDSTAREAVLADPMLGEVRRRHPDVDIVLLPAADEETADREEPEPLAADELAALVARDDRELERALGGVAPPVQHPPRWSSGPSRGTLVRRSLRAVDGLAPTDAEELVASIIASLDEHGWRVDDRSTGHLRCRAVAAGGTLQVEVLHVHATGRVAVSVLAGPYPVADDLARVLRAQQRGVAS